MDEMIWWIFVRSVSVIRSNNNLDVFKLYISIAIDLKVNVFCLTKPGIILDSSLFYKILQPLRPMMFLVY